MFFVCVYSRSSRIQDNELRDLAQKIRQENQLKERLENEQLCTVEETPVVTAENSKLVSDSFLAKAKSTEHFPILISSVCWFQLCQQFFYVTTRVSLLRLNLCG